jgi:uncharacterized protein (DUF302 family)
MRILLILLATALLCTGALADSKGLVSVPSAHTVAATADRLETALQAKGMKIFLRIDHAAGAAGVGRELAPTTLVIFGNPQVGAPLMQCARQVGIDLPQKALIWEDAAGTTWFSYNSPEYLRTRHAIQGCDQVLAKVSKALAGFAQAATAE